MKKWVLAFCGLLLIVKCSIGFGCDYRLSFMSHKELTFDELPTKIQECLNEKDCDSLYRVDYMMLVTDDDRRRFKVEAVPFGPWIRYYKLIDTQKNNVYRIEYGIPYPYIIYREKLYIGDEFCYDLQLKKTIFSEYNLK